jgi:predicted nucleotidyltransferase component of viral defense system
VEILTSFQIQVLREFAQTQLNSSFFLTGGTALSAFYLHHRLSEDLDFFTEEPGKVPQVLPELRRISNKVNARIEVRRQFASYLEVFLHSSDGEILKCDFAQDSPYRLQEKTLSNELGIFTDNVLDIACNKLSALFDRSAAKDFIDVYFIDKEILPFVEILRNARLKHVGIDDYWLAVSLRKVQEIGELPHMIKPVEVEALREFFLGQALRLMEQR